MNATTSNVQPVKPPKTYWESVRFWWTAEAICLAGLWGGRADRADPIIWQSALGAFVLLAVATVGIVAALRALSRRKGAYQAHQ